MRAIVPSASRPPSPTPCTLLLFFYNFGWRSFLFGDATLLLQFWLKVLGSHTRGKWKNIRANFVCPLLKKNWFYCFLRIRAGSHGTLLHDFTKNFWLFRSFLTKIIFCAKQHVVKTRDFSLWGVGTWHFSKVPSGPENYIAKMPTALISEFQLIFCYSIYISEKVAFFGGFMLLKKLSKCSDWLEKCGSQISH